MAAIFLVLAAPAPVLAILLARARTTKAEELRARMTTMD